MLKNIGTKIGHLLLSSLLFSGGVFGYCYYKANKNLKEYLDSVNADTLKDASRLTNESFGISWGFQADDTVMNRIDSGDLLFIKYDCS